MTQSGKAPENIARGRSSAQRGRAAERWSLELVRKHFPGADRTRLGESGPDYGLGGVGDRVIEITVTQWPNFGRKMTQCAQNAAAAGVAEWYLLKPMRKQPGNDRPWWAITDADTLLEVLAELDQLRALKLDVDAAYDRGYRARMAGESRQEHDT